MKQNHVPHYRIDVFSEGTSRSVLSMLAQLVTMTFATLDNEGISFKDADKAARNMILKDLEDNPLGLKITYGQKYHQIFSTGKGYYDIGIQFGDMTPIAFRVHEGVHETKH